ncbi:hypothetical protein MZM54_00860 [[Brevibacterium] frigoritolerans]|nr:hypothetical protein [Peribacillus frigoritolerans]
MKQRLMWFALLGAVGILNLILLAFFNPNVLLKDSWWFTILPIVISGAWLIGELVFQDIIYR